MCWYGKNVHVFVNESSHSSWTETFGEFGGLQEHQFPGKSELIQYHTEIDNGALWRDSERTYDSQVFSILDEISLVSWSSDPVDKGKKYVSTWIPNCAWTKWMTAKMQIQDGKVKWKNSKCHLFLQSIAGNRWRSNWIRVEYSPRIFVIAEILQKNPGCSARAEHQTRRIYSLDHLHVNVQRHRLDKTRKWCNLYFEFSEVKEYAKRFSQGHWTFLGLGDEKKWFGTLRCTLEGKWDSAATQLVERFKDTGHPVFESMSALSRGILKKKNRDTIPFNADASNTELWFRIVHSVIQLSIYGPVSNWCKPFGLTEEESEFERPLARIRDQRFTVKFEFSRSKTFGIFSKTSIWKQFAGKHSVLLILVWDNSIYKGMRRRSFYASSFSWYELQSQTWRGWRLWAIDSIVPWIHASSRKPTIHGFLRQFLEEQLLDQSLKFRTWVILDQCGLEIAIIRRTHPRKENEYPCCDSRGGVGSWMKSIFQMPNSDQVQNYSVNFKKSEGVESCSGQSNTSNKETFANTLSIRPSQASSFAQRTISTNERKWKVIPATSSYGGALSIQVSKIVTRMVRHYDQDERQSDAQCIGTR